VISPYAASWREPDGNIASTIYGGTVCLSPVEPRSFAAASGDGRFESILPCRQCEGCRRYQMLTLRRRLVERYASCREKLWSLQVECSHLQRRTLVRQLRRTMTLGAWLGYCLWDGGFVALIAGARPTRPRAWTTGTIGSWHARVVKGHARLRAWRNLTIGLLVSRDHYGEQVNRFYFRGLPHLPRETMQIEVKGGIRKRHPDSRDGVRAWRDGLTLYPSAVGYFREFLSRLRSASARASATLTINRPRALARVSESDRPLKLVLQRSLPMRLRTLGKPVLHIDGAAAPSTALRRPPISSIGGRDASSDRPLPRDLAEWVLKMQARHRAREPGGNDDEP
jgi:hypothetical protein